MTTVQTILKKNHSAMFVTTQTTLEPSFPNAGVAYREGEDMCKAVWVLGLEGSHEAVLVIGAQWT
jgi:hypothetical protein